MRPSHSLASLTLALALVLSLPYEALSHSRAQDGDPTVPQLFGAECSTSITGSQVLVYCHNPYVDTDRVSLHIECARWWDLDTDGDPIDAGPAMTVRLTGRCWKDVGSVWISHEKTG